jgi:adenylosuccinate synthase
MRDLHVVTDLQFGSCGKGLFAGFLAKQVMPDTIVTAWAPNAGHTFIDEGGNKFVNIALPSGIIAPSVEKVLLGPGSVINPMILAEECARYHVDGLGPSLFIHEHAAVVRPEHRAAEAVYGSRIGSTMKGVGEAVIEKIRRDPNSDIIARRAFKGTFLENNVVSVQKYNELIDRSEVVLLEGAQGFSLGMNQGFYPYCTSRDCTTHQLLSDCALPPAMAHHMVVYGVCRTFPIRVNNREFWSGPCYEDQREIEWKEIGVEPELTTVTKLPRRVFTFSEQQIAQACRMNDVDFVFLNFCNYVMSGDRLNEITQAIDRHAPVKWTGWGPSINDIRSR